MAYRLASDPGYPIIDADTHLTEPHDLWLRYAKGALRERVPQVKPLPDGQLAWSYNTAGMYRARAAEGRAPEVAIYKDEP